LKFLIPINPGRIKYKDTNIPPISALSVSIVFPAPVNLSPCLKPLKQALQWQNRAISDFVHSNSASVHQEKEKGFVPLNYKKRTKANSDFQQENQPCGGKCDCLFSKI